MFPGLWCKWRMKIRKELPQFSGTHALLLAVGRQAGVVYRATRGTIDAIDRFFVPTPKFSDKEGFFRARGDMYSGSVLEPQKLYVFQEMTKEMEASLKMWCAHEKPDEVYVFAPSYLMYEILRRVKTIVGKSYIASYCGNYVQVHPFDLLAIIADEREQRVVHTVSDEAAQLLATAR